MYVYEYKLNQLQLNSRSFESWGKICIDANEPDPLLEAAGTRFEGDAGEKTGLSLEQVVEKEQETGHV